MNNAIIIFIKNAIPGKVKTRLAKSIGNNAALKVYQHLMDITRKSSSLVNAERYLYYSDHIEKGDNWSAALFEKKVQIKGDLGEKMANSFENVFKLKFKKVIIIGSDCPELTSDLIEEAFLKLDKNDFVLGPAKDGGYYLLGMKKPYPFVFKNKKWSTDALLDQTLNQIQEKELTYHLLKPLNDIDTIEDLMEFQSKKE